MTTALGTRLARRALLAAAGSLLAACGGADSRAASPAAAGANLPPDFELSTLDGKHVHLAEHLGKAVILVDFWATFCEPCLVSLPELDALYRKHRARGFLVLGVSIDESSSQARVRTQVSKLGLSFPILLDQDTRVIAQYNPRATAPYSVLIGRDGRVLRRQEGYTSSGHDALEEAVDRALG